MQVKGPFRVMILDPKYEVFFEFLRMYLEVWKITVYRIEKAINRNWFFK